jgi:phosphate-selective porin OprO and OprP
MRHLILVGLLVLAIPAGAEEPSPSPSATEKDARYEALLERVARLESEQAETRALAAQLHQQAKQLSEQASQTPLVTFGPNGMALRTPDGKTTIQTRGLVQADGRAFLVDPKHLLTDTFLLRRVRPSIDATFFGWLDARLMPDFGQGKAYLIDAYVNLHPWRWLQLIGGKFKPPIGLERIQTEAYIKFMERAFPTNLVPSRDVGAQLWGVVADGAFEWALAVFNGVVDGADTPDIDTHDGKDFEGRVFAHPLRPLGKSWLRNLGLGFAASYGKERGTASAPNVATYKSPGQNTFFQYYSDTSKVDGYTYANGNRWRVTPQLYYFGGPFGLITEYVRSSQNVTRGAFNGTVVGQGWQLQLSLLLTPHDRNGFEGVTISQPVEYKRHGYGAFEIVARYHEMHLDAGGRLALFADPTKSADRARAFGVGLNWYANTFFRAAVNYDRTDYTRGAVKGNRAPENALMGRLQVVF